MPEPTRTTEFFDTLAKVLLRCWIFGFALLLLWLGVIVLAGDFLHRLHGNLFGLSKHELDVIFYGALALLKVLVLVLFFFPWLAIRLVLRGRP
jgi:uncharacterized protein DUF6868